MHLGNCSMNLMQLFARRILILIGGPVGRLRIGDRGRRGVTQRVLFVLMI